MLLAVALDHGLAPSAKRSPRPPSERRRDLAADRRRRTARQEARRNHGQPTIITSETIRAGGLRKIAALLFAVSACGSDSGTESAAGDQAAAAATELPSTLDLVATDFTFTNNTGAVAAGPVTVRLRNDGHEAHQVQIGRTRGDVTPEQFIEVFHTQGELAALQMLDWAGGVNGTAPGATSEATSVLDSGNYLMVCFIPDADGVSHIDHKMVVPLEVGPARRRTHTDCRPTITLADYSVTLPAGFTGQGTFEVDNTGQETHELILLQDQGRQDARRSRGLGRRREQGAAAVRLYRWCQQHRFGHLGVGAARSETGQLRRTVRGHESHDDATARADGDGHAVHDHLNAERRGGVLPVIVGSARRPRGRPPRCSPCA